MQRMNPDIKARISSAAAAVRVVTTLEPEIAIILGSGLGPLAEQLEDAVFIPYGDLPGFPVSTAPGHKGRAVLGSLEGRRVIAFQGRVHVYEGYSAQEVAIPVYLAHALGARSLIVTNACGGLHPEWNAGDIMLQNDYLNIGQRFVPMMDAYDPQYREFTVRAARGLDMELRQGVYLGITGPTYAPRAELRMFRTLGADAIGMSTVLEVIAARHAGLRVLGLSSVTDMAVADREDHSGTTEEAVIARAAQTGPRFQALVRAVLPKL